LALQEQVHLVGCPVRMHVRILPWFNEGRVAEGQVRMGAAQSRMNEIAGMIAEMDSSRQMCRWIAHGASICRPKFANQPLK